MNRTDPSSIQMLFMFGMLLNLLVVAMADDKDKEEKKRRQESEKAAKKEEARRSALLRLEQFSPNGRGEFAEQVPAFTLKDPLGTEHKSADIFKNSGMLIMLTVPNLTQYEKQKQWEKYLGKQPWPERNAPRRVLFEDLSQQTMFKDRARRMMQEKYKPDGEVMVLIDEDGGARQRFGVGVNETVILLVDRNGRIIHNENGYVEPDAEAGARLAGQVRRLAGSQRAQAAAPHDPARLAMAATLPTRKD